MRVSSQSVTTAMSLRLLLVRRLTSESLYSGSPSTGSPPCATLAAASRESLAAPAALTGRLRMMAMSDGEDDNFEAALLAVTAEATP
jgi:hypothetical protein